MMLRACFYRSIFFVVLMQSVGVAQQPVVPLPRQFYTSWVYHEKANTYTAWHYYKVSPNDTQYQRQEAHWYPDDPGNVYLRNPTTGLFRGKINYDGYYRMLPTKSQKANRGHISPDSFVTTEVPALFGSQDGVEMDIPPLVPPFKPQFAPAPGVDDAPPPPGSLFPVSPSRGFGFDSPPPPRAP